MAAKPQRLSALQRQDPVGRPASQILLARPPWFMNCLPFPKAIGLGCSEVNDLAEIEVGQRVVEFWTRAPG